MRKWCSNILPLPLALFIFNMLFLHCTIRSKTSTPTPQQVNIYLILLSSSADRNLVMVAKPEDASQKTFGEIWERFHHNSRISYEPNIQKALDSARKIGTEARGMQTLITGSQHLVGGALFSLNNHTSDQGSN